MARRLLLRRGMAKTTKRPETPWDDCKVAFGIEDDEAVEKLFYSGPSGGEARHAKKLGLPSGWTLDEVDGSGARWVAVFRVRGVPSVRDGKRVVEVLTRLGALTGEPS
jgi:hypothetical protein